MTTCKFLRWMFCTRWMDERVVTSDREVLDGYRGEDAGDLKRSEMNELVEKMICPNVLAVKIWKSNPKIVTDEMKNWFRTA